MVKCRGHVMSRLGQLGYEVHLIAPEDIPLKHVNLPPSIKVHKWFLHPSSHNPFYEIGAFFHLLKLLVKINPRLAFSYTVKANFYTAVIGKTLGFKTCSIITGLGRVFTIQAPLYTYVQKFVLWGWRLSTQIWVMNQFDYDYLKHVNPKLSLAHMPGEGVDVSHFKPSQMHVSRKEVQFLFIGRLLKAKGLEELFQAIKHLKQKEYLFHLKVAGTYDPNDQDKIDKTQLDELVKQGLAEHLGYVSDVRSLIQESDCLVLPSYREGLPRVILEANAMQCPIIATNVPGCQDLVKEGVNGFLCEPRSTLCLENALEKFLKLSEDERKRLGHEGHKIVLERFTTTHVQNFYLKALEGFETYK
ncbi:MAG: glycosyltransferase family 4 protein [Proteobacteria bacterium]|nr:glycosyltransferase family 4 protein [Pseudomonadota bacterium]